MVLLQPPVRSAHWPVIVRKSLPAGDRLRGGVLVLGNFDGYHRGHRAVVAMARTIAHGRPVAVMSCEPHPRAFFGTQSGAFRLASPDSKQRILAREGVDFIFSPRFDAGFAGLTPAEFAGDVLADALGVTAVVTGADFRFGRGRAGNIETLAAMGRQHGFAVHTAPEVMAGGGRISSTRIRAALGIGDMAMVEQLLGAPWLVEILRGPDGSLHLHPALCRPRAGACLATSETGAPVRVEITEEGILLPATPIAPGFMRLSAAG